MKQGRASESIPDNTLPIADKKSEQFLKKLVGRKDIEDALQRLDRLTQEEARMAAAQALTIHYTYDEVKGTFSTSDTHNCSAPLLLVAETEMLFQGVEYGWTTKRGCLRQTHPLIRILRAVLNMKGRRHGSCREVYSWNGGPNRPHPCCGSTGNVSPSAPSPPPRS
jgi:hypothetical protein